MKSYFEDNLVKFWCMDFRKNDLPNESIQCVVTSPPFWGLRKYAGEQELIWSVQNNEQECQNCEHKWAMQQLECEIRTGLGLAQLGQRYRGGGHKQGTIGKFNAARGFCSLCGAWKGAYGLEPTPEMYVQHSIEILREIKRVLRKDGVVFWNIGDSYFGGGRGGSDYGGKEIVPSTIYARPKSNGILKPKDLCLIPFRLAIAAQEDGWWVRSVIIWSKPNPMPESVQDRPTGAHDYILMLTKSKKYYWDADAVREPHTESSIRINGYNLSKTARSLEKPFNAMERIKLNPLGRNIRTVWEFNGDDEQGGNFYKVLQGCPIHSPLLHPDILKMVSDGEPQDCLLTHTLDKYGCLVPVLSSSLSSKIFRTNKDAHLSKLGFHHHGSELWQIVENIGDNRKLALCSPGGGHLSYPETTSHTKHTETNDGLLACSSDYSRHADELIATSHSREIHRIVFLTVVNGSVFLQIPVRTVRTLQSLGCTCSQQYNNISHFPLSSVWSFSTQPFKEAHFAVFPEKLPEICIKAASKEGDLILDPFMGSGTTLWVAKKLNRRAYGFDISEEYCKLALERNRQMALELS